jgi:general secretion pathway protein H
VREAPIKSRVGERKRSVYCRSQAGYMLIEVVATLTITMLLIALIFPMVPLGTTPSRMLALASSSASLLRDARTASLAGHTEVSVRFDGVRRTLQAGSNVVGIPADVDFSLTAGGACRASGHSAEIVFRPDGTNCGGILRFSKDGRMFRARVNWVDGYIDVAEGR